MHVNKVIGSESNVSLCSLIIAKELNLFCFMVDRSHVFSRRIEENDLSVVAEVALQKNSLL